MAKQSTLLCWKKFCTKGHKTSEIEHHGDTNCLGKERLGCPCAHHDCIWRSGGISQCIPNLSMGRSVVSLMFLLLYPWSPLNRRLHGPQQEWMFWQRNNFLPLLGNELWLLGSPASSLVTILTLPTQNSLILSFNTTQTRAVIGLLTWHNTLRRHLHVMGLSNNPTCRKCGTEEETSVHIFWVWGFSLTQAYTSGFLLFWTRRTLGCWGWGPSGTSLKEQGSYNLVKNRGHKGPVLRPRCIGPEEGPCPDYYSILF
jgi:hypothetical protein